MKLGDLVRLADLWVHDGHRRLGIIVEVEEGFYPHSAFNHAQDRVRVLWNTSEYSREPTHALKILSES
jgi:hypothetical protein